MRLRSSLALQENNDVASVNRARERRTLGEVLNLSPTQQEAVIQCQAETGRLFGEAVVELGYATHDQVRRAVAQQQGFSVLDGDDQSVDPLVVTAFDRDDALAKSVRNLRSTVTAAMRQDGQPVRSIALVGLDVAAELPVLAANLAVACAQASVRTLLVDANLDHPHQHALFRVPNSVGLVNLLVGEEQGEQVQPTVIGGLSLLTTGPAVPNTSELFDRQRLANMVDLFVDEFGLVLIDAGCAANSVAAMRGLDAAIIALRRHVTYTHEVRMLVAQLESNGHAVLGVVLMD